MPDLQMEILNNLKFDYLIYYLSQIRINMGCLNYFIILRIWKNYLQEQITMYHINCLFGHSFQYLIYQLVKILTKNYNIIRLML
jgi:hypothetical protein